MASSSVVSSSENWQRVNVIGELCLKDAYLDVLHNRNADPSYQGLPEDGAQLYQRMVIFRTNHGKILKTVIRPQQWDIICPPTGISNSNDWDITIIRVVIQYECGLPEPISGWKTDNHSIMDITIAANVCLAKKIRNELKHGNINEMADPIKYNNLIVRIERVLVGMNYRNMKFFNELRCCLIKVYTPKVVKIIEDRLSDIEVTMKDTANTITDVKKELKDELQDLKNQLNEQDTEFKQLDVRVMRMQSEWNHWRRKSKEKLKKKKKKKKELHEMTHGDTPITFTVLIQKCKSPWSCIWNRFPFISQDLNFSKTDTGDDSPLMKIFYQSFVEALKDELGLEYKQHYYVRTASCKFTTKQDDEVGKSDTFDIEMHITEKCTNPFPPELLEYMSPETQKLRNIMKKITETAVSEEYGMNVEVTFFNWRFGSIKVNGTVSLSNGEFTAVQKQQIRDIIGHVAKDQLNAGDVTIEILHYLKTSVLVDYSQLEIIVSAKSSVIERILKNETRIQNSFTTNVKTDIMKAQPESTEFHPKEVYTQINQHDTQINQHDAQINQRHAQINQHDAQINQHDAQINQHDAQINQHDTQLNQHDTQLNQHDAQINQHDAQINQYSTQLNQHDAQINQHDAQINQHDTQLDQHDAQLNQRDARLNQHDTLLNQHDAQLNQHDAQINQHDAQINQHDTQLDQHDAQLNQRDARLNQHDTLLNQHDAQLNQRDTQLNQNDTQLKQHDTQLNQNDTQLNQHDAQINQHDAQINQHDTQLDQHDAQLNQHDTLLNQHDAQLNQQDDKLNEHDTQLKQHCTQLKRHHTQLKQHCTQLKRHHTQLNQHDTQLNQHDTQLNQQDDKLTEHEKRIESLEKGKEDQRRTKEEKKETSLHNIGRTNSDPQNDPRIKVVCQIGHGCILKVHTNCKIENVFYKSLKEKSKWILIQKSSDEEGVTYEERKTKDGDTFLKVENLEISTYDLMVETNGLKLQTTATIYADEDCGHVTCVDNTFIVLAPPFGRIKDSACCKNGIDGKFVEKSMTLNARISEGPLDKNLTVEQFTDFCETYKDRNFPDTKDVITFLPLDLIEDLDVRKTARIFQDFLSTRHGLRAVVSHADTKKYLKSVFPISDFLKMDFPFLNRLTVFDDSTACVMNIRVVENNGDISKELEHVASDLKYSAAANNHLKPSCYSIGLLCFPTTPRHEVEEQMKYYFSEHSLKHMKLCYIAKEDLEDLSDWWKNVLEIELKRLEEFYRCKERSLEQKNKALDTILAQTITTIAMTNVSKTPTLAANPDRQLKTLLLNINQIKAVKNKSKRKLVMGNYSSGKSIVGDEIFKQLYLKYRSLKRKLVYAVWEKHSLLEVYKHILFDELQKDNPCEIQDLSVEIGNPYNLSGDKEVTLLQFLTDQLENNELIDIIIDELPSESVHQSEVPVLQKLLNDHPQSSIVIIPQSVIIDRTKSSGGEEPMNIGRNCLKEIGLDVFELSRMMRNTIEISSVLKYAQRDVQDSQSVLNISDMKSESAVISGIETKKKIDISKSATYTQTPLVKNQWDESNEGNKTITKVNTDEPVSIDVDKFAIQLHNPDKLNRNSSTQLSTSFTFFKVTIGNKVTDAKPILLNLPIEFDLQNELSAKILCLIFQKICHLSNRLPTLLIGSSIDEIRMISYALSFINNFNFETFMPHLQGRIPSIDEKRKIISTFLKGSSILSDNSSVKGLECKNVIIFIQSNEHFQRHLFIETLARANVKCYIFTYGDHTTFQVGQKTIGHVFKRMVEKGLIDEIKVSTYEDHSDFETSHQYKEKTFSVNKVYCGDMEHDITIDSYFEKFGTDFPMNLSSSHLRDSFEKLALAPPINQIVYEVEHEGRTYTFLDVYFDMLERKEFDLFERITRNNPNIVNNLRHGDHYYTLLMHAIMFNEHHIIDYLMTTFDQQINWMAKDIDGTTVFHYAALQDNIKSMTILISKDRRGLDVCDNCGRTPLFYAAINRQTSMVKWLLEHGADPHAKDNTGNTADRFTSVEEIRRIILEYQTKNAST